MLDNLRLEMGLALLTGLALVACDDTVHPDVEDGYEVASMCMVRVQRICGIDGSHPVSPDTDVLIELSQPSRGWDAWIEGVPTVSVREPSGDRLVVRPDHTLEPGTDYTLWIRDCHGEEHAHVLPVGAL